MRRYKSNRELAIDYFRAMSQCADASEYRAAMKKREVISGYPVDLETHYTSHGNFDGLPEIGLNAKGVLVRILRDGVEKTEQEIRNAREHSISLGSGYVRGTGNKDLSQAPSAYDASWDNAVKRHEER